MSRTLLRLLGSQARLAAVAAAAAALGAGGALALTASGDPSPVATVTVAGTTSDEPEPEPRPGAREAEPVAVPECPAGVRNHGQYVSSVARGTQPGPGHGAVVSAAARSDCGKRAGTGGAAEDEEARPRGQTGKPEGTPGNGPRGRGGAGGS